VHNSRSNACCLLAPLVQEERSHQAVPQGCGLG
jgi:hypothetical protein